MEESVCGIMKRGSKAVVVIVHGAWNIMDVTKPLRNVESYRLSCRDGRLPSHGTTSRNRGHIDSFDEYIEEVKLGERGKKYRLPIFYSVIVWAVLSSFV